MTANAGDGQVDWVLQSGMEYYREDKTTLIAIAESTNLFTFPLQNSFTGTAQSFRSALGTDWANSNQTWFCDATGTASWTNSGGTTGYHRTGNVTGSTAITLTNANCAASFFPLLCVEQ